MIERIKTYPILKVEVVMHYRIPLMLSPQPEGGFTVTSPLLPELVTEGNTVDEALVNVRDAMAAVVEIYEDLGQTFPDQARIDSVVAPIQFETVVVAS